MDAFRQGKLRVRTNLHLGVGLLAATSSNRRPGRMRFGAVGTRIGELAYVEAGTGPPLLALHGLGGTKASFLPTLAALAETNRVIALDLPGFGESAKPIGAAYDARFMARSVIAAMDGLEIDTAHLVGNSMGGRVALEAGMRHPDRVQRLVLLCPAVAWLRDRRYAGIVRLLRPELGLLQVTPRPVVEGMVRRLVPGATRRMGGRRRGRVPALLPQPARAGGVLRRGAQHLPRRARRRGRASGSRLSGLERDCLFIWGAHDGLVPAGLSPPRGGVAAGREAPRAECGHVPQVEVPAQTHQAMRKFLS